MGRLADRRIDRRRTSVAFDTCVARIAIAAYRIHRVKDRDVDNRHGAARAGRSQLLAENPRLSGRDRCVIEPGRVDCDLVPAVKRIEPNSGSMSSRRGLIAPEARAIEVAKAVRAGLRRGSKQCDNHSTKRQCACEKSSVRHNAHR